MTFNLRVKIFDTKYSLIFRSLRSSSVEVENSVRLEKKISTIQLLNYSTRVFNYSTYKLINRVFDFSTIQLFNF
jgi:hypothetical protein